MLHQCQDQITNDHRFYGTTGIAKTLKLPFFTAIKPSDIMNLLNPTLHSMGNYLSSILFIFFDLPIWIRLNDEGWNLLMKFHTGVFAAKLCVQGLNECSSSGRLWWFSVWLEPGDNWIHFLLEWLPDVLLTFPTTYKEGKQISESSLRKTTSSCSLSFGQTKVEVSKPNSLLWVK